MAETSVTIDGVTYTRELNTMPNWAGSCWYYLRYLDNKNDDALVSERWATLQTQNPHVLVSMAIPDLTARLVEVQHPVLVFWGTDDQFCPASGVWKLLEHCSTVQAELLNRCGHWVMTEYPSLFNRRCLEFLNSNGD